MFQYLQVPGANSPGPGTHWLPSIDSGKKFKKLTFQSQNWRSHLLSECKRITQKARRNSGQMHYDRTLGRSPSVKQGTGSNRKMQTQISVTSPRPWLSNPAQLQRSFRKEAMMMKNVSKEMLRSVEMYVAWCEKQTFCKKLAKLNATKTFDWLWS